MSRMAEATMPKVEGISGGGGQGVKGSTSGRVRVEITHTNILLHLRMTTLV
jgi:hypothetical protein